MNKTAASLAFGALYVCSLVQAQVGKPTAEDLGLQQRRMPFSTPASRPADPDPRRLSGHWKTRLQLPGGPAGASGRPGTANGAGAISAPPPPPATSAAMPLRLMCVPGFGPWASTEGAPTQIVQTADLVLLLFEEFHNVRKIHLNSEHPKNLTPSYAGDSIGHWDGDVLMVDTAGIKGSVVAGGPPASPTLHMTERIRKIEDGKVLEVKISYYDTASGPVPADQTVTADWVGGPRIMEWVCEDGTDVSHPRAE